MFDYPETKIAMALNWPPRAPSAPRAASHALKHLI